MITEEKLKIYKKYRGDVDSWARSGSKHEKLIMHDSDWYIIENFIQDMHLVRNNLASKEFGDKLNVRLNENCENDKTIMMLRSDPGLR